MSEEVAPSVEDSKMPEQDGLKEKADECSSAPAAKDSEGSCREAVEAKSVQLQKEQSPTDKVKSTTVDINTLTPSTPSHTPPQLLATETAATAPVIPDNILSPPKSETQTDETNTATSTSCSPASDGQHSPVGEQPPPTPTLKPKPKQEQQEEASAVNGSIPKSGKPLATALSNKKLNKSASTSPRASRSRKPKALPMYESEISDNKVGIKLCIKKSDGVAGGDSTPSAASPPVPVPAASKPARKRVRKPKQPDSDESECEPRKKKVSTSSAAEAVEGDAVEQSVWAERLPAEVLFRIFEHVIEKDGCLPTLFRLGRVCSLWRRVSLTPSLWHTMDLTTWIKEKYRTELKLKWFVDNRCSACTELNVSNWKISDVSINCFLIKLAAGCPNLTGITLSGWKGFTSDNLTYLVDNMKKLERLDLSSINLEMNASKTAVGMISLCNALQTIGSRLTHLHLAHNRLAGIPQIVGVLSAHCPNLELLDLSNVTTQATSHGVLHIEKLQHGCQKLKVLRVTNSHITPSTAGMQEIMDSPGFPNLEELSVAATTDESRIICDDHLQRLLKSSSKLKLLDVRNCTRLTHESLIRLPAWDIKHLYLSGCSVTRDVGSGLELIASKWAHSLIELDLAWANVQQPIDNALRALAEKGSECPLAHLNLCGSSVSDEAVKEILKNCANMSSINLASCRGLPRGVKRLMQGAQQLRELREVLGVQLKDSRSSGSN
ncbi:F-box/LRR-repeat protein 6 [Drosophila madeirensis]|uniref:F-box/LRR-repeat protein 6 n=1 Tax=Drosophila madeirensis TaxID=30013 RepID=A0AAU9GAI6_DROMD